jgi:hypothetical protein
VVVRLKGKTVMCASSASLEQELNSRTKNKFKNINYLNDLNMVNFNKKNTYIKKLFNVTKKMAINIEMNVCFFFEDLNEWSGEKEKLFGVEICLNF